MPRENLLKKNSEIRKSTKNVIKKVPKRVDAGHLDLYFLHAGVQTLPGHGSIFICLKISSPLGSFWDRGEKWKDSRKKRRKKKRICEAVLQIQELQMGGGDGSPLWGSQAAAPCLQGGAYET